jgi:hypothetical protein
MRATLIAGCVLKIQRTKEPKNQTGSQFPLYISALVFLSFGFWFFDF